MNIRQTVVASRFLFEVDRDDLEALKVCLHNTYHYRNHKIPKHLQSITSHLMDAVEAAIRKDDEIQRKVRSKP
jgi:hypothetical protein